MSNSLEQQLKILRRKKASKRASKKVMSGQKELDIKVELELLKQDREFEKLIEKLKRKSKNE